MVVVMNWRIRDSMSVSTFSLGGSVPFLSTTLMGPSGMVAATWRMMRKDWRISSMRMVKRS